MKHKGLCLEILNSKKGKTLSKYFYFQDVLGTDGLSEKVFGYIRVGTRKADAFDMIVHRLWISKGSPGLDSWLERA